MNASDGTVPPVPLADRLRAQGLAWPEYGGGGLLNLAATVLQVLGLHDSADPPVLAALDPALRAGVRDVLVVVADGLGWGQLERLRTAGAVPFLASLAGRAEHGEQAQLVRATTIFPSTTTAAITTLNTARTPQEHGNLAYFTWLEEFGAVTQMLRWGPAVRRHGSYFDDPAVTHQAFVQVPSIHRRARDAGLRTVTIEPERFKAEAMSRMHAAETDHRGYLLPSGLSVRIAEFLDRPAPGDTPTYAYAYWPGIDTVAHRYGPGSPEEAAEAAMLDVALSRALLRRRDGRTLVLLTADHGHAAVEPDRLVGIEGDRELRAMLRTPPAGEPRCVFLHTDHPQRVTRHLTVRYPGVFECIDRDEAIAAGLFGRGDPGLVRRRVGEVCALLRDDHAATIVRVEGEAVVQRGAHGGLSPAEMEIPILAWRV